MSTVWERRTPGDAHSALQECAHGGGGGLLSVVFQWFEVPGAEVECFPFFTARGVAHSALV